jgi:hypothetical protein
MTKEELKENRFVGVVEDNKDPKRIGRCKIRVLNIFDGIPVQDIPWAKPKKDLAGNVFSVPDKGKVVTVIFSDGSIYKPEYIYAEHYNVNLEAKLKSLSEDDYNSFRGVLFDHATQIYRTKSKGLILDNEYTNVNLDQSGNINFNLRNNDAGIHLGTPDASQQAVLGNHFTNWMKRFLEVMSGSPFIGNFGSPVAMQPDILKNKEEFSAILMPKILSKNVKIVDNTYVKKQKRDYEEFYGDKWKSTDKKNNLSNKNDKGGRVNELSKNSDEEAQDVPKPNDKKNQQNTPPQNEQTPKPNPETKYDIIFLCGLDDRKDPNTGKLTDLTKDQQTEIIKKEVGEKRILSFRYFDWQNCVKEINKNPNAFVVFFSGGCTHVKSVADRINDKSILGRFYIVEPYGLSKNTIKAVNEVVSMGVPVSNVIVGQTRIKDNKSGQLTETKERGMGIIEGATITPDSYNHFGAIKFVSKFLK